MKEILKILKFIEDKYGNIYYKNDIRIILYPNESSLYEYNYVSNNIETHTDSEQEFIDFLYMAHKEELRKYKINKLLNANK